MGRRRIIATSLTLSILCTLALYAYSWTVSPREVRIGEIGWDDAGAFVRTQGHVRSAVSLAGGGSRIELFDIMDYSSISVFVSEQVKHNIGFVQDVVPGAQIWVAGEIREYHGTMEIAVTDSTSIGLISPASKNRIGLSTLAQNPDVFLGVHVVVRGELMDIGSLVDWEKVSIHSGGDSMWVEYGGRDKLSGRVDVYGRLLYNEARGRPEIKVAGDSDSILPHPSTVPQNYTITTIAMIVDEPDQWVGRLVAVLDVTAIEGEVIGTAFSLVEVSGGTRYVVTCMLFGWDWSVENRGIEIMAAIEFAGEWNYYTARAQWQIVSDEFSLRALP